jgi:putative spermidine/putrescine transport system permease protein
VVTYPPAPQSFLRRLSTFFYSRPILTLIALLSLPLLWLLVFYIGALISLLINSFFYLDDAGLAVRVVREFSLITYRELFTPANMDIVFRTFAMAAAVSVFSAIIAFPFAYYMARYAHGRVKGLLYLAVTLPLWSSYLVRVYSWKLLLANEGVINWFFNAFGLGGVLNSILEIPLIGGRSLSVSYLGMFLVFVYIWLPYMILPIYTALERVPRSLIDASSDLGARPSYTFWNVILPLAFPGVIAGSIFTFSLTLGDYIIPGVVGPPSLFIGSAVFQYQGTSGNIPLAAAMTSLPIVIMLVYLTIARRLGAFDAL